MNKKMVMILCLVMVCGMAAVFAATFTATDKAANHGKIGLKNLTGEIDANFALLQSGQVTMHAGTVYTGTFATAYSVGTTPIVVATYTEDPGDVQPLYVTANSNVGFTVTVTADKNFAWMSISE